MCLFCLLNYLLQVTLYPSGGNSCSSFYAFSGFQEDLESFAKDMSTSRSKVTRNPCKKGNIY